MFYVGDVLWLEKDEKEYEIPDFNNFSGCIRWAGGAKYWYEKGWQHSPQDPITQEWLPAIIYPDGRKLWLNKSRAHSFTDPVTGNLMPAAIYPSGFKEWYDKGAKIIL